MIRVAIVEDDPICARSLRDYLLQYQSESGEQIETVCFPDGLDIVEDYRPIYDLIFLDIEMPHMDGISAAKQIRAADPAVLMMFITNMAQYAICGYEVGALDYVLKPVNYYAFALKINTAVQLLHRRNEHYLLLPQGRTSVRVPVSGIRYIEVSGHHLCYHMEVGTYTLAGTLRDAERQLEGMFFARCNACYLVSLRHVTGVQQDTVSIAGQALKISRPRKKEFMQALACYYGGVDSD